MDKCFQYFFRMFTVNLHLVPSNSADLKVLQNYVSRLFYERNKKFTVELQSNWEFSKATA